MKNNQTAVIATVLPGELVVSLSDLMLLSVIGDVNGLERWLNASYEKTAYRPIDWVSYTVCPVFDDCRV